jgi:hypothetical protein
MEEKRMNHTKARLNWWDRGIQDSDPDEEDRGRRAIRGVERSEKRRDPDRRDTKQFFNGVSADYSHIFSNLIRKRIPWRELILRVLAFAGFWCVSLIAGAGAAASLSHFSLTEVSELPGAA